MIPMWLIDAFRTGFTQPVPVAPLCLFRVFFALSCTIKFLTETKRGYYHYLEDATFLRFLYDLRQHFINLTKLYKAAYVLKIVAALFLLAGVFSQAAAAILTIWFVIEGNLYFKFHTSFFALLSGILMLSPDLGSAFTYHTASVLWDKSPHVMLSEFSRSGDGFVPVLIVITTSALYILSGIRKLRSPDFYSGVGLRVTTQHLYQERHRRRHAEILYPQWFVSHFIEGDERRLTRRWKCLSIAVVVVELILPVFLLNERTFAVGFVTGMAMHAAFTFALPVTLAHFSMVTVSTYILFMDPDRATSILQILILTLASHK